MAVQNVTSTVSMDCAIDLSLLNACNPVVKYDPSRFTAAILKLEDPRVTALIFNSGRLVCTGGRSIEDNEKGARLITQTIQQII